MTTTITDADSPFTPVDVSNPGVPTVSATQREEETHDTFSYVRGLTLGVYPDVQNGQVWVARDLGRTSEGGTLQLLITKILPDGFVEARYINMDGNANPNRVGQYKIVSASVFTSQTATGDPVWQLSHMLIPVNVDGRVRAGFTTPKPHQQKVEKKTTYVGTKTATTHQPTQKKSTVVSSKLNKDNALIPVPPRNPNTQPSLFTPATMARRTGNSATPRREG